MRTTDADAAAWLSAAHVDSAVYELRPDYRALLVVADGLVPGPSDATSDGLLEAGEREALARLAGAAAEQHPNVAAWRAAFRAFGAKPQRTRSSVEALLRRVAHGLPRVDRLTDAYNAVSVAHVLPLGGEDLDHYRGPLRLTRATGDEPFEITADGEDVIDHPDPGEVVWGDDLGVICRRWNWRQCTRTRLSGTTTRAVFVLDCLAPMTDDELNTAADALRSALLATSPHAAFSARLLEVHGPPSQPHTPPAIRARRTRASR
ncbi:MAG: B3/B4 domain-containing protein [Jiangellaceae bacterium]